MAKLQLMGGSIYLEPYAADGSLGDKVYPGTTDEVTFSSELEKIDHNNTETEEMVLDGEDVVKRNTTLAFTTSDINDYFNKVAFLATESALTQVQQTDTAIVIASAVLGKVEDVGYLDITSIVVKDSADTITYVEGEDYSYDKKWGTVIFLEGGAIVAASEIHITLSANAVAGKVLESYTQDKIEFRMTYQGRASTGLNEKHVFEKVSISLDGDRTLKSGDRAYSVYNFTGAVLKHNGKSHTLTTF